MRKHVLATALLGFALAAQAASPAPEVASKKAPAVVSKGSKQPSAPLRTFGLTQSLAVLFACPQARFDNAQIIALGGVLSENKARIEAAPVNSRMELMTQLVAEETAKANDFVKTHKVDCEQDAQPAAAYWNRLIEKVAAEQGVQAAPQTVPAKPAAAVRPTPPVRTPSEPVTGLQLP